MFNFRNTRAVFVLGLSLGCLGYFAMGCQDASNLDSSSSVVSPSAEKQPQAVCDECLPRTDVPYIDAAANLVQLYLNVAGTPALPASFPVTLDARPGAGPLGLDAGRIGFCDVIPPNPNQTCPDECLTIWDLTITNNSGGPLSYIWKGVTYTINPGESQSHVFRAEAHCSQTVVFPMTDVNGNTVFVGHPVTKAPYAFGCYDCD